MASINLDRRSFLKAAGGLGALSIAGVGIAGLPREAHAEEAAFAAMSPEIQKKMRRALSRIVNEGKGGVLCVLL